MDTDYDRLELLSVLHEVLPPSFPLNVIQDMHLDDAACFTSSLSKVSRKFSANHRLERPCLVISQPVQSGLHRVAQLILEEQLRNAALPALILSNSDKFQFLRIRGNGTSALEYGFGCRSICIVDSCAEDRPELISKAFIGHTVAVADLADPDGFQDAACAELLLDRVFIHRLWVGRCEQVWLDAAHISGH